MSRRPADFKWSSGQVRKPGTFVERRFKDYKGGDHREDHGHGQKVPFKAKSHTQNRDTDKLRNLALAILDKHGELDRKLVIAISKGLDTRIVRNFENSDVELSLAGSRLGHRRIHENDQVRKLGSGFNGVHHRSPNSTQGYRITILFGNNYRREYILNSLHNLIAPDTFVPIMYTETRLASTFYVDSTTISQKLQECDRKIAGKDGSPLRIKVTPGFPRYNLDQTMKDRMREAIAKKYVTERSALDLSWFHRNPDLVNDYFCSLFRTPILITVLKIVSSSCPNLVEISLDNNNLQSLENLYPLKSLSCLKILGICDNRIDKMSYLDSIRDFKLEELRMTGNPICEEYAKRQKEYVSEIRQRLPNLQRLDGFVLQAEISFDLATDKVALPSSRRLFSQNEKAQEIASQFLQAYFQIFDSENRQPLLNAYDENASFSMTVYLQYNDDTLQTYLPSSRNLCKVFDTARRRKLLKQGRLSVVASISELPRTQHDLSTFTMDISLVTERMMVVTVGGIFRELDTAGSTVRYFNRTFVITPQGTGYCIINEMLQILKPTKTQEALQLNSSSTITTTTTPATIISDDVKAQMTMALRECTNMTLAWSLKCLNDVQWDFNMALAAFQGCQSRGEIPPDAFEK